VREKAVQGRVVGFPSDSERDWADLFRRGRLRAHAQRTDQPESTPQLLNLQVLIFLKEGIGGPKMKSENFGARARHTHTHTREMDFFGFPDHVGALN
jgi:hypothetical protein